MKLTCPACGADMSLDVILGHEGAREAVLVALRLPSPLGKLLVQYIALFRPARRNLSMDRLASLLAELQPMIDEARVMRNGISWPAPQEYWISGLTEVIARRDAGTLTLPLKSHGYLLEVIAGYGNRAAAKAEQDREAKRGGQTQVGYHPSHGTEHNREPPPPPTKSTERSQMPVSVREMLNKMKKPTQPNEGEPNGTENQSEGSGEA